jgi:hypothetical protein
MPVVNGKLTRPDLAAHTSFGCKIQLVDQTLQPVRGFKSSTNETIFGPMSPTLTGGAYSVTLPDNAAITPANTMYQRTWSVGPDTEVDYYVVPTGGGPYEEAALSINVSALSLPASNLVTSVSLGATTANIAVSGLTVEAVPGMTIIIPNLSRTIVVYGNLTIAHQTVASSVLYGALSVVGNTAIASAKGTGIQFGAAAGDANGVTVNFQAILPPNSAGNYTASVNGASGNVHVIGGTNGISSLVALAV